MKKLIYLIVLSFVFQSCEKDNFLEKTFYRGEIEAKDDLKIPFNFKVLSKNKIEVYNSDETIFVDEISYKKDSIIIKLPVFEGYIIGEVTNKGLNGWFKNDELKKKIPFKAYKNVSTRFTKIDDFNINTSGKWELTFGMESNSPLNKGILNINQEDEKVKASIRTNTGDHRYLEGIADGNKIMFSAFDGAHAFLYVLEIEGDRGEGYFYSGNNYKEKLTIVRNDSFELLDPENMTKANTEEVKFSFPNVNGQIISLKDDIFKDKVVVLQLLGSWCPNCLDESKFLKSLEEDSNLKNVQFVGLAFEYSKTKEKAINSIKRLKNRLGINYPILLAQYGTANKNEAQNKLPFLDKVYSYPTTIVLDKNREVKYIHTGFDGPATGAPYLKFKEKFVKILKDLQN